RVKITVVSSVDSILASAGRTRPASSTAHDAASLSGHARGANGISLEGPGVVAQPAPMSHTIAINTTSRPLI
ncbi:MAG: hypothetical protein ACKOPF_00540, partial [Candidatus Limnocylindrus sp.]